MIDPIRKFNDWYEQANKSEDMAEAVALATADERGRPSVRMVLLKGADEQGFTIYTNIESRKGREIIKNPYVSLCFHWKSQKHQIRVEGPVAQVSDDEADRYFSSRSKDSQIGAWASKQSQPMEDRLEFEKAVAKYTAKYALTNVPRPPFWTGFRLKPDRIEFWEDRKFRLHMRYLYEKKTDGSWAITELYP